MWIVVDFHAISLSSQALLVLQPALYACLHTVLFLTSGGIFCLSNQVLDTELKVNVDSIS